mmetsp:Transcript_10323/g.17066  ORF Transcript_10323/g.17066 Transcript_10323/m.17066 type:complete len:171 (-) Transcript_10323:52-564(-)|eukprot:CAMPEP_0197725628 /NCGR_PEP_ID=MMETSP1434-20131217/8172_1 /TAXON_ID=265543 /ORGANISM="Minutocellus polymorphus, Strain CCMP3303" /LENGTH=170 /DNA_ID=CAMNT_0043311169 /DNA_START=109 /DNA_END=621 /DNA_ORIENTATION=+
MFRNFIFLLVASFSGVSAFTPSSHVPKRVLSMSSLRQVELGAAMPSRNTDAPATEQPSYSPIRMDQLVAQESSANAVCAGVTGLTTGWLSFAASAMADYYTDGAVDDLEIESLPPPYVPIIFAIVIIGGVGLLTSSLGDVMYDEASLGMQSGAQAKKERERSRASYFKKK